MKVPRLLLLSLTLFALTRTLPALATVASPHPFQVRQPDGTTITLHVRGDEWFHWYETPDGHAVTVDPASGFWVYLQPSAPGTNILTTQRVGLETPQSAPWRPSPSAAQLSQRHVWPSVFSPTNAGPQLENVNSRGVAYVPLIFADFSDIKHTVSSATISNTLFATGPGVRSMATFYSEVSYGQFTVGPGPSGIQDWIAVSNPAAFYAPFPSAASATNKNLGPPAALFVRHAVLAAIRAGYKFAPYDQTGEGKVPVVDVVHAGRGEEDGGGPNVIWSHRGKLSDNKFTDGTPLGPITADGGVLIDDYVVEPELQTNAVDNADEPSTIGVFCHEFGHALGLPDLYDTDNSSLGVGAWSVMGGGTWNGLSRGGDCPAHFDAWSKIKLGWLNPVNYTLNYQNVAFPAAEQTPFAVRLWKDGLASPQYFLAENRYQTNFDAGLPASGMLIWHIDDTKGVLNDNSDNTKEWFPFSVAGLAANTNKGNYHVALIQADNNWDMEAKVNGGDAGDPFPGTANNRVFGPNTAPSSYAYNVGTKPGYNSYVTVSNISNPGMIMTADLYTRSPNSGPQVDWVNIGGVVPPSSEASFTQLDDHHPVVIRAFPSVSGTALSQAQLYINRAADGRWWNFGSHQWETNSTSSNYNMSSSEQYGLTLAFESNLPTGTDLPNGDYTFIMRVIDALGVVTELQMVMTAVHAPEVTLSLADNAVVNTLTNFTAVATENSGLGVQRVEIALYWDGAASEGAPPTRWFWSGTAWTTTPEWLGADFPTHPAQATLYYPIGPDAPNLLTEKQYTIAARAVDAFGDAVTNAISVFFDPGPAATVYWRYPASGNWFDPANWMPTYVPGPNDHAVINAPGDYTVTVNGNANVGSLRFGRVVGLNRQHLAIAPGASLQTDGTDTNKFYANATLDLGGALNAGKWRFSSGAAWLWTNGTLAGSAELTPGAGLAIVGAPSKYFADGASLLNRSAVLWLGGSLTANGYSAPSWITNGPGGVFLVGADGELFRQVNGYHTMVFANLGGLFNKTMGTNTLVDTCQFINSSEVRAESGLLSFNAALQLNDGGSFTGSGGHLVTGGTVGIAGVTTIADSTLELADGQFQGAADNSGTFATSGAGRLVWSGGTLLAGTVNTAPNARLEISGSGAKTFQDNAVLENRGQALWRAGTLVANGYSALSVIRNDAGALFTIANTNSATRINGYWVGQFQNQTGAWLVVNAPGEAAWNAWQLINDGTVLGQAGALRLDVGGASSGLFTNLAGAEIRFAGGTFTLHAGTRFLGAGTARVEGATLTADGYVTAEGSGSSGLFSLDSGTLNGTGFTSLGLFHWTGGDIGGVVSNAPGALFTLAAQNATILDDGAVFNNAGVAQITGGEIIANGYSADSTWNNLSGAHFDITTDGGIFGRRNGYHLTVFNNFAGARLGKTAGTNSVLDTCVLNNSGELRGDSGTLAFNTTLNLNPGGTFTGAGRQELAGGGVAWNGATTVLGTTLNLSGATVTGNTNATIVTSGGGLFDWSGGALAGTMNLPAGSSLQLSGAGAKVLADGAIFNNGGAARFVGPGRLTVNGYSSASTWNNLPGGHFDITSDGGVFGQINGYHSIVFNNQPGARLAKTTGTNSVLDTCTFNNGGEVRSDSGTLAFNGALNLNNGGTFTGAGRHELIGGSVFWSGATTVQGTMLNLSGATVSGDTNATLITTGNGLFDWSGGTLAGTMNLTANSQARLSGTGSKGMADSAVFNNAGMVLFAGTGRLVVNGYSDASTWNNLSGAHFDISSDGGVFGQINGYHAIIFNNNAGARLAKTAGNNSLVDTCTLNNAGELRSDSGTLTFNATLNLNGGGVFTGTGRHEVTGGTVTFVNTTTVQGPTVVFSNGSLVGGANGTVATAAGGVFDWSGGALNGTLTYAAGGSFRLSGPNAKLMSDSAILINSGTVTLAGSGPLQVNGYSDKSIFNNLAGGVIQVATNATWGRINGYYRGLLINSGTLLLNSSPEVFQADWDYTQTASGTLNVLLAGGVPGTQFSQANFAGNATLNGTLAVALASGFAPTNGQSFAVLNYGAHTGQFSTQQLPTLPLTSMWTTDYGATAATLRVIPVLDVVNPVATIGKTTDSFKFDVTGPSASSAIVWMLVSGDPKGWQPIYTNSPFTGLLQFTDPAEPPLPAGVARLYRVQFEGVTPGASTVSR